jgi:hypothetical protein
MPSSFPVPSPSAALLRRQWPMAFVEPGDEIAGPVVKGAATLVGAGFSLLAEAVRQLSRVPQQSHQPSATILERPRSCGMAETAGAYLSNLQRDGLDQALRSIPPRTFSWQLPSGHTVEVRQGVGKDGLTYDLSLRDVHGKQYRLQHVRVEVNQKGVKVPVGHIVLRAGDRPLGKVDVALRADTSGLNEVTLSFTGTDGRVYTAKLKTQPCEPDVASGSMLRQNVGSSRDAAYWGEAHLASSARARGGNLHQGLTDLLMQVRPSANGVYRNHGSATLDQLARPLELLRGAGVDFSGLHDIQDRHARLARLPNGRPIDVQTFRAHRRDAWSWLQGALQRAVDDGHIRPEALVNRFGLNYGLHSVALASTRASNALQSSTHALGASAAPGATAKSAPADRPYAAGEGIGTPYGRVVWAGIGPDGVARVRTRTSSYALPAGSVDLHSRDAVRAWVLRSVERGHISADRLYGASQAPYLEGERIGTPYGDLRFRSSGSGGGAEVAGRDRAWHIKPGVDLGNRDAVRAWAIRAIKNGQIDRRQLLAGTSASSAAPAVDGALPTRIKVHWRTLQQKVRAHGFEAHQMPDGRLFLWRIAGTARVEQVARTVVEVLDVPDQSLRIGTQSLRIAGKSVQGNVLEARVFER